MASSIFNIFSIIRATYMLVKHDNTLKESRKYQYEFYSYNFNFKSGLFRRYYQQRLLNQDFYHCQNIMKIVLYHLIQEIQIKDIKQGRL
ncbi:hypothetical protein pb186bvf_019193 [Paramecium bursaria]